MIRTSSILVLALAGTAFADPANRVALSGTDARALTLGLKLAGIPPTKTGGEVRYTATRLSCTTSEGGVHDDGLEETHCEVAGKSLSTAQAELLDRALDTALGTKGLPSESGMSKTTITVASIDCRIIADDQAAKSSDRFSCEVGLRDSLVITPKKLKVKDIVQPVKIQKQDP